MQDENYYEPRYVSQSLSNTTNWFYDNTDKRTLLDAVFEYDKIVLLGNPGIGKTKELNILFEKLWEEKEMTGRIPFSVNLKNFRKINKFEDLIIYPDWKTLSSIIFILDGLDEISEIQDFISAFELFISQNIQLNIKYIISCRTNIYEKYLVNISDFESFHLEDLSFEQSVSLLLNKYGVDIENYELSEKHSNYLKTPFFLELFSSYILDKQILPISDSEMWELFIEKTLDIHEKKQSKKSLIDRLKVMSDIKKVAFTNELMQQNFSSAEELNKITGNHLQYIEYPFIVELSGEPKRWNFVHRQIQEYLVAKTLTEKTLEEILSIIKIPNIPIEVIHPSLFNTITFLINLLDKDSEKFKKLIIWLKTNQIEILFRADSDRTESFQEEVFKHYFNVQCIVKKLWISTNKAFSVKEIGEFGDCDKNFKYLFDIIENQDSFHFRVVISALNLLAFFKPNLKRELQIKPLFIKLLASHNIEVDVKSQIIRCCQSLKFHQTDAQYLDNIFSIFETETNKEINASLLFLLYDLKDVNKFYWYIKAEFLREMGIEKRNYADNVHRGNDWKLQELILKLENPDHFIEIISYYFIDNHPLGLSNDFANSLLKRFLFFSEKVNDLIVRLLKSINGKTKYYLEETLLKSLITQSSKQFEAAKYLIDNNSFSEVRNLVSNIANKEILVLVLNRFKSSHISSQEIDLFRNYLWHSNRKESYNFQKLMSENGFVFDEPLPSENEREEYQKDILERIQSNFDSLFDKILLLQRIENVFIENGIEELTTEKYYEISAKWKKENNYPSYFDNSLATLQSLFRKFHILTFYKVSELLNNDVILYKLILDNIKGNTRDNLSFVVSTAQKKLINDWCISSTEDIDFNNIVEIHNDDSFTFKSDYLKLETILSFQKYFEISLPKQFLLNCLEYFEIKNFNEKENPLVFLFDKINDKKEFDKKIIENIKNKILFSSVLGKHIDYALKNNIKEVHPNIREYFLEQKSVHNLDSKLEIYFSQTKDIDLLKECCYDVNDFKCWSAIKILTDQNEKFFCIDKAVTYLNQEEGVGKDYFVSNAMQVLFHFKSIKALEYYLGLPNFDFYGVNFYDYSVIEDFSILETLFFRIFKEDYDKPDFGYGSTFFTTYVSNLSKKDINSYTITQEVLIGIKEKLKNSNSDNLLFNVNFLIDNSTNSFISSQSVPLSFKEALNKVESIFQ